jgi:hypothetical protein
MPSSPPPTAPISPQPPARFTGIQIAKTKSSAAGVPAVTNSLKHVYGNAGLIRGTAAMLQLNQWEGFDCPSCAWPDPDDHRSAFEFCENGAKAIASETTRQRVTPQFFADHSVAELADWTDYEMDQAGRLTHSSGVPHLLRRACCRGGCQGVHGVRVRVRVRVRLGRRQQPGRARGAEAQRGS